MVHRRTLAELAQALESPGQDHLRPAFASRRSSRPTHDAVTADSDAPERDSRHDPEPASPPRGKPRLRALLQLDHLLRPSPFVPFRRIVSAPESSRKDEEHARPAFRPRRASSVTFRAVDRPDDSDDDLDDRPGSPPPSPPRLMVRDWHTMRAQLRRTPRPPRRRPSKTILSASDEDQSPPRRARSGAPSPFVSTPEPWAVPPEPSIASSSSTLVSPTANHHSRFCIDPDGADEVDSDASIDSHPKRRKSTKPPPTPVYRIDRRVPSKALAVPNTAFLDARFADIDLRPLRLEGLGPLLRTLRQGTFELTHATKAECSDDDAGDAGDAGELEVRFWTRSRRLTSASNEASQVVVVKPAGQVLVYASALPPPTRTPAATVSTAGPSTSLRSATLLTTYHTLGALPPRLRRLYRFIEKVVEVVRSQTARLVFRPTWSARDARCAVMMNDCQGRADVEVRWSTGRIKSLRIAPSRRILLVEPFVSSGRQRVALPCDVDGHSVEVEAWLAEQGSRDKVDLDDDRADDLRERVALVRRCASVAVELLAALGG